MTTGLIAKLTGENVSVGMEIYRSLAAIYTAITVRCMPMLWLPKDLGLTLVCGYWATLRYRIMTQWFGSERRQAQQVCRRL